MLNHPLFVDLNSDIAARISAIRESKTARPEVVICAFCSHDDRDLRRQAKEAGADYVVVNKYLAKAALRIVTATDLANIEDDSDTN